MHPIIYDVAVSLDGYISGPSGDISQFAHDGPVVDDYANRLAGYATALMGRATYEFGYQYGLEPGQNPYGHMQCYVFSKTLTVPENCDIRIQRATSTEAIMALKEASLGPIYLCGGGAFAGWLLSQGLIDKVRLKRAPLLLGSGVSLFGGTPFDTPITRVSSKEYDNGYILEEFDL